MATTLLFNFTDKPLEFVTAKPAEPQKGTVPPRQARPIKSSQDTIRVGIVNHAEQQVDFDAAEQASAS